MLKERIYRELGRQIGTTADARLWANAFGCDLIAVDHAIKELKAEGRAIERTNQSTGEAQLFRN